MLFLDTVPAAPRSSFIHKGVKIMGRKTARFVQYVQAIPIRSGFYYSGWFATGGVQCDYWFRPRPDEETRLTVWKHGGGTVELGRREREFLLRKLSAFSGVEWPHSQQSDEEKRKRESLLRKLVGTKTEECRDRSLAKFCQVLGPMFIRRKLELTPDAIQILTQPKFGCVFPSRS